MVSYLIALRRAIPHIEIGFGHPDDAYLVYVYERQVDGGNWRGGFVKSYHGLDELIPSCAVLEIDTNPSQEKEMIDQLELYARGERRFRLVSENCSSYVAAALRPLGIDENQTRTWYGASFPRKLFALAQKKFSGDGPIRATTLSDFRFNGYRWG